MADLKLFDFGMALAEKGGQGGSAVSFGARPAR